MKSEAKVLIGIVIVSMVIVLAGAFFLSSSSPDQATSQSNLVRTDSHFTGSENAKVTVVEFGDYQCPACGRAHPIVKQLLKEYSKKIKFVFRNFPLPQHQNALISAEAAEAAGSQGKFWQMHDLLYENQVEWAESTTSLDIFTKYAKQLKLDIERFKNDVAENKYKDTINQDRDDGNSLGVNSTPTFYVNGEKSPSFSYETLKSMIERGLF